MPTSAEELVELLMATQLLSAFDIEQLRQEVRSARTPANLAELADRLVTRNRLTRYQADELLAGRVDRLRLGNYVLLDLLGKGGMGLVYRARHERMKREVAIKTLPPDAVASESAVRRFHREVEVAARLQHPRIVTAFDADEAEGVSFLVMEYVRGESLAEHVRRQGPVVVPRAVDYLIQAAEGLAYAHREDVIHRDIKPANLLLDQDGRVKILDMGLARSHAERGGQTVAVTQDYLTQTGMVLGTVDYLAPEQARNIKAADQRADIYSLGCTLHFLLTGKPLYEGKSLMEKIAAHQKAEIPSLRAANPEIPEALDGVFQRLVAKRPEDRYAGMDDVIAALRPFEGDCGPDKIGGAESSAERLAASGQTVHRRRDDTSVVLSAGSSTSAIVALSNVWQRAGNRTRAAVITMGVVGILLFGIYAGSRLSTREAAKQTDTPPAPAPADRGDAKPAAESAAPPNGVSDTASAPADAPLATSSPSPPPATPPAETTPKPADVDRDVARRVLALGGKVVVVVGSQTRDVSRETDLPSEPFVVREIVVSSADWADDDLTLVGMLKGLVSLEQSQCRSLTDEGLRRLKGLTGLRKFVIYNAAVTSGGLAHLTGNRELETLAFRDVQVDDGAVDVIKQFPALVGVHIIDTPIFTGSRLGELAELTRFDHLSISGRVMESQSAAILAGCPKLAWIALSEAGDATVREAAKIPGVTQLKLGSYRGTPAGLSALATMPNLAVLWLSGGTLTDEHADAIGALTRLRELEFTNQSFLPATLVRIRMALPACRLIHDGTALDGPNRAAAEWVLERGGKITIQVTSGTPREVLQTGDLPSTPFRVIRVNLSGVVDLKDAELAQLSELTRLEGLNLSKTPISDAALSHCEHLWELRELYVSETAVGDAGLASLSRVASLRSINLAKTQVTDAGLAHLKPLINLDYLNLGWVKVSDAGLAQISDAPKLRELWLNNTLITDAATDSLKTLKSLEMAHLGVSGFTGARLDELAALPKLSRLILYGHQGNVPPDHIRGLSAIPTLSYLQIDGMTNAHLAEMARLPQVTEMYIGYTTPTGSGLAALAECQPLRRLTVKSIRLVEEHIQALAGFKQLTNLHLADTGIDAAGVQRLTQALPQCQIKVTPPLADTASTSPPSPMPPAESPPIPADIERAVASRVVSLGGTVVVGLDSQARTLAREQDLPSEPFTVREIVVSSADWTDDDLTLVGKLTELRKLTQWGCRSLTDAGLARLQSLTGLELFAISEASVTVAGLGNLTNNRGLRHFYFGDIIVDDDVVDILKQFPSLYGLNVEATNFTGARLGELSGLSGIQYLAVPGHVMASQPTAIVTGCPNLTGVQLVSPNDESLRQVTNLKKLTWLTLACWERPAMTAQGLSALAAMTSLAGLKIGGVPAVTDADAEAICSLTQLRRLEFENQVLSPAALSRIRQALPACQLIHDGTALDGPNRAAAEWVLERGGEITIQVTSGTPREVLQTGDLPSTPFRVIEVDLAGVADLKDAELEQLSQLTRLQSLNLARTAITDVALSHCEHLWELSRIHLEETAIGDEGLGVLSRVPSLRALNLQKTRVTDAGLAPLKSLTGLNWLHLGHTQVTDAGLAHIAGATKLRELWLAETQITDASMDTVKALVDINQLHLSVKGFSGSRLEELAALPKLSHLWLGAYNGHVPAEHFSKLAGFPSLRFLGIGGASDAHLAEIVRLSQIDRLWIGDLNAATTASGLAALESLDKLRSLTVFRTKLSPEYLDVLARLTRLEQLELINTDIDAAGVQRLTQGLPKCKIQITPPLADAALPARSEAPVKD